MLIANGRQLDIYGHPFGRFAGPQFVELRVRLIAISASSGLSRLKGTGKNPKEQRKRAKN